MTEHKWEEVFETLDVDSKVENFHNTILEKLNTFFPVKTTTISSLDKKWMSPELKQMQRRTQREFFKRRKSKKWKKLKKKFKILKRKTIQKFYKNFVEDLKQTDPSKWYGMTKRIGAVNNMEHGDLIVEELVGVNDDESAELIAEHFASVSQEYLPLDTSALPSFLPAPPPPTISELQVYKRLEKLKKTKSTQPIDLPFKLRKEFAPELAAPVADILNACLKQQKYPSLWKQEWVTPVPKVTRPKTIKELRKISSTSEFSKLFEGFLKDWIMEDISPMIDNSQYENQEGSGTEHMMVALVDKILSLLD